MSPTRETLRALVPDRTRLAYYGVVVTYACWQLLAARGYRPDTRLLPTVVGTAVLALVVLRGLTAVVGTRGGGLTDGMARSASADADGVVDSRRLAAAFGWLAGLFGLLFAAGLLPAVGAFVFAFTARYRGYRAAAASAAGTLLFVYLLFVLVLDVPTFEPFLVRVLEGIAGG